MSNKTLPYHTIPYHGIRSCPVSMYNVDTCSNIKRNTEVSSLARLWSDLPVIPSGPEDFLVLEGMSVFKSHSMNFLNIT